MAEGTLIIEIYEFGGYMAGAPAFSYIPCRLSECLKKNQPTTLKDIIQSGFNAVQRQSQNEEKRQETLRLLEEADIGRIRVAYHPARGDQDASVELTNVRPVSMSHADARRAADRQDEIILYGQYELSNGGQTTELKDAQRLTLTYTSQDREPDGEDDPAYAGGGIKIVLHVTYLQEA